MCLNCSVGVTAAIFSPLSFTHSQTVLNLDAHFDGTDAAVGECDREERE